MTQDDQFTEELDTIEDDICEQCNGSGEGQYDGTRCGKCRGRGTERRDVDPDEYYDYKRCEEE